MPNDKQSFLQKAKMAVNKVYLDATNKLVMDRPSYGRDQSEKRVMVEMSRRQGEQEYWQHLKDTNADEFYKQASVNLGQTSGPRPLDALVGGAQQVAGAYGASEGTQTAIGYAPLAAQVAGSILSRGGGAPKLEEPMPMKTPGMRLNLAPGKAMEIAKTKAVAPAGAPAGDLGELEAGLQASAKRMFPSVEERTAGTQIGDAIAARQTEGGHGGGGVASVEELNRQREYVNVGRGKVGYQGVQPDPGARGLEPGRAIYSTPKGQVQTQWRLESGTPAADHQGALDGWAKAMGRKSSPTR